MKGISFATRELSGFLIAQFWLTLAGSVRDPGVKITLWTTPQAPDALQSLVLCLNWSTCLIPGAMNPSWVDFKVAQNSKDILPTRIMVSHQRLCAQECSQAMEGYRTVGRRVISYFQACSPGLWCNNKAARTLSAGVCGASATWSQALIVIFGSGVNPQPLFSHLELGCGLGSLLILVGSPGSQLIFSPMEHTESHLFFPCFLPLWVHSKYSELCARNGLKTKYIYFLL